MAAGALAEALSLPMPLAALLVQRGYSDPSRARAFLRPSLESLSDPYSLAGMREAVARIVTAVQQRSPILVHGDYDVDGQCSTALLTRVLRLAGAVVHPFVPHRIRDGYDFGAAGLARAIEVRAGLIITCDCGITAHNAVLDAINAGFRVVVTDHHLPGPSLPDADAVVDPQRVDDASGLGSLCGTGVVFKLAQALVLELKLPPALPFHLLDYVALATIADVVPLAGENRILVKHGLRVLADSRWVGLRALLRQVDLADRVLRAGQVGFTLAPRLNAVGRIGDANDGLKLLLSDDPVEAGRSAQHLDVLNRERQALDQRILDEAIATVDREYADPVEYPAIILAAEGWHPGVIGIVASRIVERYGRPTFLVAFDGDTGKGSGRSVERFDLHAALSRCAELLVRYGGHRMAAGLTIERGHLPAFRERFRLATRDQLGIGEGGPTQRIDLLVGLCDVTDDVERLSRHLEPCGMGNPSPIFGVRGVRLGAPRVVGSNHLKTTLQGDGCSLDAIGFDWGDRLDSLGTGPVDAAFRVERNEYQGRSSLQARICSLAPGSSR